MDGWDAAEEAARTSYGRLVALLAARSGDIAAAEDALADAFERALLTWPVSGTPRNPDAWLLTVARNRERDRLKSAGVRTSLPLTEAAIPEAASAADLDDPAGSDEAAGSGEAIPDKRLELMFVCAHPAIDPSIRTPLMLQTVLGVDNDRISRAYALPAPTMAQRLVRAKRRIKESGVPFTVPGRAAMPGRLPEVLEAVYGAYAIDWYQAAGPTARDSLADEAQHLALTLTLLLPEEPEVLGLAALLLLSRARAAARLDSEGRFVPLEAQDTRRWDPGLIARGERLLLRAHRLASATSPRPGSPPPFGRFQLEAAIHSAHCDRLRTGRTDWVAVARLTRTLILVAPTLGARVSLAAAVAETDGPDAGLRLLDAVADAAAWRFQPLWATRALLLERAGRTADARPAYEKAVALSTDLPARDYLAGRLAALDDGQHR